MIIAIAIVLCVLCAVQFYLIYRLAKRLLEYSAAYESVGDSIDALVEFCEETKQRDLITNAPEVIRFHRKVQEVADKLRRSDG